MKTTDSRRLGGMRLLLVLCAALTVSAQMTSWSGDRYSVPAEYFTAGSLNGEWWMHATEPEKRLYMSAWSDGRTDGLRLYFSPGTLENFYFTHSRNIRVKEALRELAQPLIDARQGKARL